MVSRQERLAKNQDRFRRANERLHERISDLARIDQRVPFLCECADETCTAPVNVTLDEYADVRGARARFLIVPGHPTIEGEEVVAENERYAVAEKSSASRVAL
jgi:glutathionylspermidine synthase